LRGWATLIVLYLHINLRFLPYLQRRVYSSKYLIVETLPNYLRKTPIQRGGTKTEGLRLS